MKKINIKNHSKILSKLNILRDISVYKYNMSIDFIENLEKSNKSNSEIFSSYNIFYDILINNEKDYIELYNKYRNIKNKKQKLIIRFGEIEGNNIWNNLSNKLKSRKRPAKIVSALTINYWTSKGLTLEQAKNKISNIQSKNSKIRHSKMSKFDYKKNMPNSLLYWTSKGYSEQEAEDLREPFLFKSSTSLDAFIARHGEIAGKIKFEGFVNKRKATLFSRYGTTALNGCVSKESLKIFIPLYKKLRYMGIQKEDICWGIKGSREFATRYNNKNYFYDFTIKSLKIIIEYNNIFWHAREDTLWKGFGSKDASLLYDNIKHQAIQERGYHVIIIWNDDDILQKYEEIIKYVNEHKNN